MNIVNRFINLKVSKKLFFGFATVLLITLAILTTGLFGLLNIQDKVDKNGHTTDLFNALSAVRLNRTNYQYTLDQKYLDQVNAAIQRMQGSVSELEKFSWTPDGKARLDATANAMNSYVDTLSLFTKALGEKKVSEGKLNTQSLCDNGDSASLLGQDSSLPPAISLVAAQMSFILSDIDSQVSLYKQHPTDALRQGILKRLDPRFETDTVELLQRLAASQVQLVIEITEKHPLHFTPELCEWFATLRRANIAIALDDFGTGYSNLSWIAALAPEFIKIDKLFISQIIENGDTRLVEGLIELARKMQLTVIAEGVETQHQVDYLREKAIAFMQGYYFARPIPAGELIRMTVAQHGYAS